MPFKKKVLGDMSSTQNSNSPQQPYEVFSPDMEKKETADAHLFIVYLPDFKRHEVGANYEAAYRRIRVFGEQAIENNKRKRFSVVQTIPEYCDADKLKGHFEEGAKVIITMPKKPISSIAPKKPEAAQKQEAAEQESASEVESEAGMKDGGKGVSEDKPKSEMESQRESDEEKDGTPPTPPEESHKMPQEDQKHHEDKKKESTTEDSSPTTEKAKGESRIPPKDQEGKGIPQEGRLDDKKIDKSQKTSEEGKASLQEDQSLEIERSKEIKRKESDLVIADESSGLKKTPEKNEKEGFQKNLSLAREKSKEERKEPAMVKKEKQMDIKTDIANERNHGNIAGESSRGKGIKDMASSASQTATRLANRFIEEDKQKLLCAGAAILVVVIGIYASFKLRSMTRQ